MRKRVSRWSTPQRAVMVVAWAGVLAAVWDWARRDWDWLIRADAGWFNYAPNSGVVFSGGGNDAVLRLLLQLAFVAAWFAPSFWVFSARDAALVDGEVPAPHTAPDNADGDA